MAMSSAVLPWPGLPVIATQVGGNPELVAEGRTGVLVPPGDVDALVDTIAEEAQRITGRAGSRDELADVEGGDAVVLDAIRRGDIDGTISLLITGDEEGPAISGTKKVLKWMEQHLDLGKLEQGLDLGCPLVLELLSPVQWFWP